MKKEKIKPLTGERRYREVCRLLDHLQMDFAEVRDEIAILKHQVGVIKSYVVAGQPAQESERNGNI